MSAAHQAVHDTERQVIKAAIELREAIPTGDMNDIVDDDSRDLAIDRIYELLLQTSIYLKAVRVTAEHQEGQPGHAEPASG